MNHPHPAIDYARIICPHSCMPISECDCQNCVIARMEQDYQDWRESENLKLAMRVTTVAVLVVIISAVAYLVQR